MNIDPNALLALISEQVTKITRLENENAEMARGIKTLREALAEAQDEGSS